MTARAPQHPVIETGTWTLGAAQRTLRQQLTESVTDAPSAALEADWLLMTVLDCAQSYLFTWPEALLTPAQQHHLSALLTRRLQGEPLAYILGHTDFWGLRLQVTPETLIPRSDTETLVETALKKAHHQAWSFLDLGTGSGAVICALKKACPTAHCVGIDASAGALKVATTNAQAHDLAIQWHHGDWFHPIKGQQFDCILSNPPYIDAKDPHLYQGDLRFEPVSALVSEQAGLADLMHIIKQAPAFLHESGWLMLEHGADQGAAVRDVFAKGHWQAITTEKDKAGHERVTLAQKPLGDRPSWN